MDTNESRMPIGVMGTLREDIVSKTKTLYDARPFEIFWRNLLAGASRALGALVLYGLFVFLFGVIFLQVVYPKIQPIVSKIMGISETIEKLPVFSNDSDSSSRLLPRDLPIRLPNR